MPNIDQVQLPDGSQYNLRDNISGYVTAQYVNDAIDGLTKANVGLGNVDNTSDLNKPVSTAQQTALNEKTDTTVIAPTEATTTASRRYEVGEQFILNGVLYTATAVIASGDTIIVNTNCALSESITEQLKDIDLSADNVSFDNTGTDLVSENVEDAIKEVNAKTKHGWYEVWTNPSPTSVFAGQSISFDGDYDDFEIVWGRSTAQITNQKTPIDINAPSASLYNMVMESNKVAVYQRSVTYSKSGSTNTLTFGDCSKQFYNTYGSASTNSTDNSQTVPFRVLALVHNN